jgi:hypothetical protein
MLMLGQERFGELNGTVTDATGAVVPNVKVVITSQTTDRVYSTTTGGDGTWVVKNLEPGRYSVRFEATGFSAYEVPAVNLLVGQTLRVDGKLQVGATEQVVQVTEAAPLIDVSRTTIANNVTSEEIDRLPKARTFQGLALLSPSVNTGEIEGGFQVNGASGAENQFIIDGISTNSLINGKSRQNAVFEILQEVQVKTGGIDAEYGGAMGGVISAITKSGGNAFHGDVHYYFSGSPISAGPVERLLLDPRDEKTVSFVQDHKFQNDQHEVGYSLGGYIIKDKLFFFSAGSPRWLDRENTYIFSGGDRGTLRRDQTQHLFYNKVDFVPFQTLRMNFGWLWTPTKSLGRLPAYSGYGNESTQTFQSGMVNQDIGFFQPQNNYQGQIDWNLTPTSLITFRAARFWDNFKTVGIPDVSSVEYGTSAIGLPFPIPPDLQQAQGFSNTPRQINTFHDLTTRTYFQVDASKFGTFLGQHNLKGGWGITKTVNNVEERYPQGGYVRVFWNQAYRSLATGQTGRGTYGYYELNDIGTQGTTGGTMYNMYIQDQWRIHPRLTLTLGLRTENEVVPSFRRDIKDFAFKFGFGDKIAPRLGASFDVFGDGRFKVYGSWGRYFDWVKYELARGTFGGDIWRVHYRGLDTLDIFNLANNGFPGQNLWSDVPGSFRDRRVPSFGEQSIDPDIKPMSTDLMNAGVEFQISSRTVFRGNYTRNNLRRTMEDIGALVNGDEVYIQANPGEGLATTMFGNGVIPTIPTPKPKRTYDAMELTVSRRFGSGFFGSASYVLSRLYGNYSGLANSDEIRTPTTGVSSATAQQQGGSIARPGGNVTRNWDLAELLFDSHGNLDIQGRLATDRPHVIKLYGSKIFNWGSANASDVGVFFYGGSGTPLSTVVNTVNHIGVFVNGRGDMGRTAFLTQTDLVVGHEFKFGEVKRLRLEFNALNLFNQKTSRSRFSSLNRGAGVAQDASAININNVDLYQGYDYINLLNNTADQLSGRGAYDPRYGLDDLFNTGFEGRIGIKFSF